MEANKEGDDMSYKITYRDGRIAVWPEYDDAIADILHDYPDAEIGHSGDLEDGGDRTIAWETEEDSINDDGANSIASITDTRKVTI